MLSLSPLAPICANWEWRWKKLSALMEVPGACCVLRFTFLIITGIYVSVTLQLGSWISFSTAHSINLLNFSTLRRSGIECLGAQVGSCSTIPLVWGVRHCLVWFCGQPRWALALWRGDSAQLQKWCSCCPQSWASCPVTHLSWCWSPRAVLVVKHWGAQSHLCSLEFLEVQWRKDSAFGFSLKSIV